MAITISATRSGTSANYLRYLAEKPTKTWKNKESCLLDLALIPFDGSFVKLQPGDYVTIDSTKYPKWFTGFVTNDPELEYLGSSSGQPKYGYKYKLSSDDYILNLKQIGIIPAFFNLTYGRIIKVLAEKLAPGFFNTISVQDGPVVAVYQPTPEQKFIDIVNEFMDSSKYIFYAKDKKLYFLPQDDPAIIDLSFSNQHFTPARLGLTPVSTPSINDVIVFGDLEPQTYVHEYFVGTGVDAEFPLVSNVFGVEDSVLLDEQFGGNPDSSIWVTDDLPADYLQVSNSYLNILGGAANGTNDVKLYSINAFPMEGRYRIIQGEWDFLNTTANGTSGKAGIIGGFWSQIPNLNLTGCIYGLAVVKSGSNILLRPVQSGVIDTTQDFTVDTTKRYVIRTITEFFKLNRVVNTYSYVDSTGNVVTLTGTSTTDDVHFQTLISEVEPTTSVITRQFQMFNLTAVNSTTERYASYCPVISDNLRATVTNISIGTPVNATLEVQEEVVLDNASFDNWITETQPAGWQNYVNCFIEEEFVNSGNALKLVPETAGGDAYVTQTVGQKLVTGEDYRVTFRAQKQIGATIGMLKVYLQSASLSYTSTPFTVTVSTLTSSYESYEGDLVLNLPASSDDMQIVVQLDNGDAGIAVWVDDLIVFGAWKPKLIGPNQIDALDGLTPVATIVTGNDNNKNSYTGTVQYNTGQSKLTFFKDSSNLTSEVPAKYHLVRLSYRAAGYAIGRVSNASSVSSEATAWGDNGYRSVIKSDISPKPRTSLECELAAKAVLMSSGSRYEGTYEQWSDYFTDEPIPRMLVRFTDHPELPTNYVQQINEVVSTLESNNEDFNHKLSFGTVDRIKQLLDKIENPKGVYQKRTGQVNPSSVDIASVGANYIADVARPYLVGWDNDEIFINTGEAPGTNCVFEVRYTDESWGVSGSKNLLISTTSQSITIPRTRLGRVVFIRRKNTVSGLYSRYSSCIHVDFPIAESVVTQEPVVIAAEVPPDPIVNVAGIFTGYILPSWGIANENGTRPLNLVVQYQPPFPLGNFKGVRPFIETSNGLMELANQDLSDAFVPGSGATVNIFFSIEDVLAGITYTLFLPSYSDTIENEYLTAPRKTFSVPAVSSGTTPGIEYSPLVTSISAVASYGFLEDGSQAYRFTGSFTEPTDTKYGGCKIYANPVSSPTTFIEIADCPQGINTFATDLWAIQLNSEDFTIYFVSYDASAGRANTIVPATTPKVTPVTVVKQVGSAGREYADLVTAFSAQASVSFTEGGDQKYRFFGNITHPVSDPRYKGCTIFARTNNLITTVLVGNNSNVVYWSSGNIFAPDWVGRTITINGVDRVVTSWTNSVTITVNFTYTGVGFLSYNATLSTNEDIELLDVYPDTPVFSTDEWPLNSNSETFILYARSFDTAKRLNNIQTGVTPSQTITVNKLTGTTGLEIDSVGGITLDNAGSGGYTAEHSAMGETMWYASGEFIEPLDPRYGGCQIILVNTVTPAQSREVAFVPKSPNPPQIVKFKTDLMLAGLGTVKLAFISVDTNGRKNTYVYGTTQEVIINSPGQGQTVNLAYATPSSLDASKLAATIRAVAISNDGIGLMAPGLPSSGYLPGQLIWNANQNRLYKVSLINQYQYAIDGQLDVVADSINTGQIAAGAITTTELFAGEILVGGGGGKPTKFRVNDSFNNMVAFIGDNGTGFQGGYFTNLQVGPTTGDIRLSANSSGMTITNAPFSLTLNGVTVEIKNNNVFGDIRGLIVKNSIDTYPVIISPGELSMTDSVTFGQRVFLKVTGTTTTLGLYHAGTIESFRVTTAGSGSPVILRVKDAAGTLRVGITSTFNPNSISSMEFVGGILVAFS